jgi:hypothetical protein
MFFSMNVDGHDPGIMFFDLNGDNHDPGIMISAGILS